VTVQASGPGERELLRLMKQRGLAVRSRHVAHDADGCTVLECSGWYRGRYPDWSCSLVQAISGVSGVTKVEWRDGN